jgi:hypothetical protein
MAEKQSTLDRHEYGTLYHQLFPKESREACRKGWHRWQKVFDAENPVLVLHPAGATPPKPQPDDYWIFAKAGPLDFQARCAAGYLPLLPQAWLDATTATPEFAALLNSLGTNQRSRARAFVHNSLVDGYVMTLPIAPAMAGAIAWLLSTAGGLPIQLSNYHLFGYDIVHIPRPAGVAGGHSMFNFRAVFSHEPDPEVLARSHALPLPEWRSPPH